MSSCPPLVGFDIETDTTECGLDPELGAVVAAAVTTEERDHVLDGDEADLLRSLDELLAGLPPGLLVTWNGAGFDLPYVARRAEMLGVPLGLRTEDDLARRSASEPDRPVVRASWYRLRHLDGLRLYRSDLGRCLPISCALKPLARLVGLAPTELDREAIHLATPDALRDYVASDARTAVDLVRRRMPLAAASADRMTHDGAATASLGPSHSAPLPSPPEVVSPPRVAGARS